jgi:hypothetical protein
MPLSSRPGFTLAVLSLLLAACRSEADGDRSAANATASVDNRVQLPEPEPLLDRSALIAAADEAASAFAVGSDDTTAQKTLVGRRFAFRMAFGCPGLPLHDAVAPAMRVSVRDDGNSYEVRAGFPIDAAAAGVARSDPDAIESVEGFWVQRPWLRTDQCPKPLASAAPP